MSHLPRLLQKFRWKTATVLIAGGIRPNVITVTAGTLVIVSSGLYVYTGSLVLPSVGVFLGVYLDSLDGMVARRTGRVTMIGSYLDSCLDRLADAAVFAALAIVASEGGQRALLLGALACLSLSQLVSYMRAKAEALGAQGAVGYGHRLMRYELLAVAVLGDLLGLKGSLTFGVWALAFLCGLTVCQRFSFVRKQLVISAR